MEILLVLSGIEIDDQHNETIEKNEEFLVWKYCK